MKIMADGPTNYDKKAGASGLWIKNRNLGRRYNRKGMKRILQIGLVLLIGGLLIRRLWPGEDGEAGWLYLERGPWLLPVLTLMLAPLNWALEVGKWRWFFERSAAPSWPRAFAAYFAGIAAALVSPARAGEYGGRLWLTPAQARWPAFTAMLAGNCCQWAVMMGAGAVGLAYYGAHYWPPARMAPWLTALLPLSWLAAAALLAAVLLARALWKRWTPASGRDSLAWRWRARLRGVERFSPAVMAGGLALSAARYGVYGIQFLLLLWFFGVAAPLQGMLAAIASLYALQAGVPLPPLAQLPARGGIAVALWSVFGANDLAVLAAAGLVFIINAAIPALLGVLVMTVYTTFPIQHQNSVSYENRAD
jgi:hypothetical protein